MANTEELTALGEFRLHLDCCSVRAFSESGCTVYFPAAEVGWRCLSGDRYSTNHSYDAKLADLIFAWRTESNDCLSCVLELKSGGFSVSGVVSQLQNGAEILDRLLRGCATVKFLPVLIHGRISTVTLRQLGKQKVKFRGKRVGIDLLKCGGRVESLRW